ncbi:hypothetical protein [Occallatibacter savannae]|uniref:hypothetical protein n=1 Tax=Occallatibacter savannae TaxID=1002691 RepID=UPI000D69CC90|nr:hypothetical protein [Occallatibacter savannae]
MATKKSAAKKPAKKSSKKSAKKSSSSANYTKPELRERIKKKVVAGSKGGRPGQWSARKAQLVTNEYKAEGGGFKNGRSKAQRSLKSWGDERWHTSDGKKATRGKTTHRYLPDKAWKELSPSERKSTDRKKTAGSRRGKQFVKNTPAAAKARKRASKRKD